MVEQELNRKEVLDVPLQPRQLELLRLVNGSPARWLAFGGSRGGSKSHGLRAVLLLRALAHDGTRHLLFRRTFRDLHENHIEPLFRQYPSMREHYHTGNRELTLPNNSVVVFGYAEFSSDITSFQGKEYLTIGVDEAQHVSEGELMFLRTCCRWPGVAPSEAKMLLTCNPGGVSHGWIKRLFVDRDFHEGEDPEHFAPLLQSRAWQNVEWAKSALAADGLTERDYYLWSEERQFKYFVERTDYGQTLDRLPQALRVGSLLGSWDVFAGQYFTNFDPSKHVFDARAVEIKPWWPRWVSIDWGFQHPSAVYWHCMADDRSVLTYREFVQNQLSPGMLAAAIIDRSEGEKISQVWLSPDAFAKRGVGDSIAEQLGKELQSHRLPFPAQADNDRKGGWQLMYGMFERNEWRIANTCRELIKTLPLLSRDETDVEDCVKFDAGNDGTGGDDPADSAS